jgi:hypothetical protein
MFEYLLFFSVLVMFSITIQLHDTTIYFSYPKFLGWILLTECFWMPPAQALGLVWSNLIYIAWFKMFLLASTWTSDSFFPADNLEGSTNKNVKGHWRHQKLCFCTKGPFLFLKSDNNFLYICQTDPQSSNSWLGKINPLLLDAKSIYFWLPLLAYVISSGLYFCRYWWE